MIRRTTPALAVLAALLGVCAEASAGDASLPRHARVRIQVSREVGDSIDADLLQTKRISGFVTVPVLIGRLEHLSADSLTVRGRGEGTTVTLARTDVEAMERWSPGDRGAGGAILGVLAGGVLGGLVGHSMESEPEPANCGGQLICDLDFSPSETATGVLIGAVLGGALGYALGQQIPADKWEPVELHHRRAGLLRSPSGAVGLGLSRTF